MVKSAVQMSKLFILKNKKNINMSQILKKLANENNTLLTWSLIDKHHTIIDKLMKLTFIHEMKSYA